MYRRILVGGATAAVIVGAGGTALAVSGSDAPGSTPSTASSSAPHKHRLGIGKAMLLRRLAHGQIVTHGKDGFVTHDLIKGTVTSVSATSISVKAGDNTSETFVVNNDTKVRMRTDGKGAASSIGAVATGDHVLVAGTGTSTFTAKHILDVKK